MPSWYESQAYKAWTRLYGRFNLKPVLNGGKLSVLDSVIPITNMDTLLATPIIKKESLSLASGTNFFPINTCPKNKRWWPLFSQLGATIGNSAIGLRIGSTDIQLEPLRTAESVVNLTGILVDEGDDLGAYSTGDANDTSIQFAVFYLEEDLSSSP